MGFRRGTFEAGIQVKEGSGFGIWLKFRDKRAFQYEASLCTLTVSSFITLDSVNLLSATSESLETRLQGSSGILTLSGRRT